MCAIPVYIFVTLMLVAVLPLPQDVLAQEHVVTAADLHRDMVAASQARDTSQAKVLKFLSTDPGRKALKSANVPYEKVQKALAQLSDEELARLVAKSESPLKLADLCSIKITLT